MIGNIFVIQQQHRYRVFLVQWLVVFLICFCTNCFPASASEPVVKKVRFRAGAAAVDITPIKFPVIVNGYFRERVAQRATDRIMSRALVLDDGKTRLAIVVVDSLMIRRELLDVAKQMASEATGIPVDRMMISSTHSHSAPSAMGCLGSRADVAYQKILPRQIASSIIEAFENLKDAKVGWGTIQDYEHNHCRRWIFRSDKIQRSPFGDQDVRAMMHPGHMSRSHVGPSGPADFELSLLSVQSLDGRPIAVLGNYANHYYGSTPISGDFCGRFGVQFGKLIGVKKQGLQYVGMMSQGTSGDSMWMDYSQPSVPTRDLEKYTLEVCRVAYKAYQKIEYHDWVSLAMAETKLKLRHRIPDEKRLKWARGVIAKLDDRRPRLRPEIYAWEQVYLHEEPDVELKLQAIRIGGLGMTSIPNEVYGITGLKLKMQSPLQPTFNIELANGAQGYIPPPEQHALGGYTTWAARTAGLEVEAEPKIVSALLLLLEKVADKPRRAILASSSAYSKLVLASQPVSYWRLSEMSGSRAIDVTGNNEGEYEKGVAFYLPGFVDSDHPNIPASRAVHFAGGRMKGSVKNLGERYSVELWFWNGMQEDVRAVTGYFFSRGAEGDCHAAGDHLGIGGTHLKSIHAGKLIFFNGNKENQVLAGRTSIRLKSWNHVVLIRDGKKVVVYLNGNKKPDITGEMAVSRLSGKELIFLGGRNDGFAPFEGKLSEVAVYNRALSADEIESHFKSARTPPQRRE